VSAAFFHAHGRGVPTNRQKAIALLEPLCAKAHEAACKLLETLK
jgi:TPR repeat protein